jgi:hypothetical protein
LLSALPERRASDRHTCGEAYSRPSLCLRHGVDPAEGSDNIPEKRDAQCGADK